MPLSSRTPPTNEEIIHRLRYDEEWRHRSSREYFFDKPLDLPLTLPPADLKVELEHIQDSCNKSTAIYITSPRPKPRTLSYNQESTIRCDIIYTIYERWLDSHNVDIDFGNFFAKLICTRPSANDQAPVQDIISFHRRWCDHVESTLPSCATSMKLRGVPFYDRPYNPDYGVIGINSDQNSHFKLRPLFRALILIADNDPKPTGAERVVKVIRTDLAAELSAPIDLASIEPKIEYDLSRGQQVTTTLSAAYDFVTALELREQAAYPGRYRDPEAAEELEGPGCHMKKAKSMGYSGPAIQGSSSGWIHLNEDEEVLPPVTPLMVRMRCQLRLGPPRMPWGRKVTVTKGWCESSSPRWMRIRFYLAEHRRYSLKIFDNINREGPSGRIDLDMMIDMESDMYLHIDISFISSPLLGKNKVKPLRRYVKTNDIRRNNLVSKRLIQRGVSTKSSTAFQADLKTNLFLRQILKRFLEHIFKHLPHHLPPPLDKPTPSQTNP